jgi:RHS repeat-associated protein
MKYDIWGNTDTPAESELPSFTGKQQDASGLYYFNARYYDPETMRFLQEDPAKEGLGWYNYVGNNPVNATDPDGMMQEHGTGGSGSNRTGDDTLLYMPGRIPRRSGETRWQAFTRFAGEIFDNAADDFLLLGQQFAETAELQARQNLLISETLFDVGMSSAAGAASPFYIVFQLLFETPDYIMVEAEESKAQRNYAYRHGGYMPNPWYRQEYLNPEAVRWDDENNRFYTSTASDLEVALSVIEVALFFVDGLVLLKTSLTRSQNYRIAQMIISEDDALQMAQNTLYT